ncbi:hypothetical protein [Membranihabitans marinus]|uniref:hypothetical protein n=1 Tax=Membranihabitans marinus TaxID=1227546 RepID=UPI001F39717B|nr:hypothetical protein [Membranihabitans marinus]
MKWFTVFLTVLFLFQNLEAQDNYDVDHGQSLASLMKGGQTSGHIRNYFMTTIHIDGKNYYTDALGGLINYKTKAYKGFQLGISASFTFIPIAFIIVGYISIYLMLYIV